MCPLGSSMQFASVAPTPLASAVEGVSLKTVLQRSSEGVVVANFGRGDCAWCNALEPDFDAAAAAAPRGVSFVSVPMDISGNERAVRKFGIRGYPHVAAIYKGKQVATLPDDSRRVRDILKMAQEAVLVGGGSARAKLPFFFIRDYGRDVAKARRHYKRSNGPCLLIKKMERCPYCDQITDRMTKLHSEGKLRYNVIMVVGIKGEVVSSTPEEAEEVVPGFPYSRFLDASGASRTFIVGMRQDSAFVDLNAIADDENSGFD